MGAGFTTGDGWDVLEETAPAPAAPVPPVIGAPEPVTPRPDVDELDDDHVVDAEVVEDDDPAATAAMLARMALVPVVPFDLLRVADPGEVIAIVGSLRRELRARVDQIFDEALYHRGTAGKASPSWLLAELTAASRAREAVDQVAAVLLDVRRYVDGRAVDVVRDVLGERRRSAKVSTEHGEIEVTETATTATSVDEPALLDLLGTWTGAVTATGDSAELQVAYAEGARAGIAALRGVLGASPAWKSTALATVVKAMQAAGEGDLAARFDATFARVDRGEPTPKITVRYAAADTTPDRSTAP